MAALGGVENLLGGLDSTTKKVLTQILRAFLPNLRFGPMDTPKAENFAAYKVSSTTGTSTGEFSFEHGIGRAPYLAHECVDLTAVGARLGVAMTVTRAADDKRVYFKPEAGSTNVPFSLYLE